MTRAAIVELLHAGLSDKAIARQLHIGRPRVRDLRAELDIPKCPPGYKPAASVDDVFWRRAQPTDDGHLTWPGLDLARGSYINHAGRKQSVHRIAFRIGNGREPVGKVRTGCGTPGCIHPRHVDDQPMRDQYRAIFAA
ncbi:hypothetical protein [Streptomyces sp. NPDC059015]|uniref:hypothetical protein n=1 Tax=unclassified Streptomyces TaxID=2593676 RepID=UPI0036933494